MQIIHYAGGYSTVVVQSDRDWDHEVDESANRHIEAVVFIVELDCGAGAEKSQSRTTNPRIKA